MKKKIIITGIVIVCLVCAGWFALRFGVNFLFDKYIIKTTLSSIASGESEDDSVEQGAENVSAEVSGDETQERDGQEEGQQDAQPSKPRLSNTEIITRVMRSPELTNKMASMVPYEDKRRVLQIVMSNFTANELTEIAKNVSKGMTSQYKSQMIAEARSRLTPAQWQECLNIAYKYIEEIRPYVE